MTSLGSTYIEESEYAAVKLFEGIQEYTGRLGRADLAVEEHVKQAMLLRKQLAGEESIAKQMVLEHLANEHDKLAKDAAEQMHEHRHEILGAMPALAVLSGGVLQLGKQGISTVYGKWESSPNTRQIAGLPLAEVIWAGRNHALHYEDPKPKDHTRTVFEKLEQDFGKPLSLTLNPQRNLAFHVLCVLGWYSYKSYLADMNALLCPAGTP